MKQVCRIVTALMFACFALGVLWPASQHYEDKDFMGALCWFALSLCFIGIGGLFYLAASALPED